MICEIPVSLDLRGVPDPGESDLDVPLPVDLSLLAAHMGHSGPVDSGRLTAWVEGAGRVPVQSLASGSGSPAVLLRLSAGLARGDSAHVLLRIADQPQPPFAPRVVLSQGSDLVGIHVDGRHFATYRYRTDDPELPRPYFHPVTGPTGAAITQDGEFPGTKNAHFHHTGLFLAHQNFTGGNNWQIGPTFSRMRHLAFDVMESGPLAGRFVERLEWLNVKGDRAAFHELRTITVPARPASARIMDVESLITCGELPAVWNATPYHLLAIRLPYAMLVGKGGTITNSEGEMNPKDGTPAKWIDYSGSLNGACGVALFNHPDNPRHPTPFLNFQNQTIGPAPSHREPLTWQPGEKRRFRFRVCFHSGDAKAANVAREYELFAAPVKTQIDAPRRPGSPSIA